MNGATVSAIMRYDQDTKRYHRFLIRTSDGSVTGNLYFSRDAFKKGAPKRIVIEAEHEECDKS